MSSRETGADLAVRYAPFIGATVRVTAPRYSALDPKDQSRIVEGTVLTIARRENGIAVGDVYDMVIRPAAGMARTINLRRITSCTVVACCRRP